MNQDYFKKILDMTEQLKQESDSITEKFGYTLTIEMAKTINALENSSDCFTTDLQYEMTQEILNFVLKFFLMLKFEIELVEQVFNVFMKQYAESYEKIEDIRPYLDLINKMIEEKNKE